MQRMNTRTRIVAGVLLGVSTLVGACSGPARPGPDAVTGAEAPSAVEASSVLPPSAGSLSVDEPAAKVAVAPAVLPGQLGIDLADPAVAASAFVGLRDDWLYASNDDLENSLRHVLTEADYPDLETQLLHDGLAPMRQALLEHPDLQRTWYVTVPLTAKVMSQSADEARVEVWEMQMFSRVSISDPVSTWSLHTLTLEWTDDRWQVAQWNIEPGPTARIDSRQGATTANDFDDDLDGHSRLVDPVFDASHAAQASHATQAPRASHLMSGDGS